MSVWNTSARLFLYLEHGAKCQGSEEFESTLCSSKITFELQRERAGGWWQIQNFNAMSSRRLKNKQTSKQTIKISESESENGSLPRWSRTPKFWDMPDPVTIWHNKGTRMTLNKHVFISSRLILIYFIGFLSMQVNQSDYSSENASRNLELTRVCNLIFIIFAWKMCLKTRVNPTFLMNIRIPRSLLLKTFLCSNKNVYDLRDYSNRQVLTSIEF